MGRYRSRERASISSPLHCGTSYNDLTRPYGDGPWVNPANQDYSFAEFDASQEWCWDELHPGPPYRQGGPFNNWSIYTDWPHLSGEVDVQNYRYRYNGGFVINSNPMSNLSALSTSPVETGGWGDPSPYGASAWSRFRPGKPRAGLGQALVEIRDLPRMLRTTAKALSTLSRGGKGIGDQWLNIQFGWRPFLKDLFDFYRLGISLERRINRLRRENGQWKKVGGTVDVANDTEDLGSSDDAILLWPALSTYLYRRDGKPKGNYTKTRNSGHLVWFEGRMRYYIPGIQDDSFASKVRATVHLYGLDPTPSLLWEVTPWSWLIDWVSNTGDIIDNISSSLLEGVTAKYAYVMCKSYEEVTITATNFLYGGITITDSTYARAERKCRVAASPFGFGLDSADFSAKQWSILAALGFSRLG